MAREHPDVTDAVKDWPKYKKSGYTMAYFASFRGLSRSAIYKAIQRRKGKKK